MNCVVCYSSPEMFIRSLEQRHCHPYADASRTKENYKCPSVWLPQTEPRKKRWRKFMIVGRSFPNVTSLPSQKSPTTSPHFQGNPLQESLHLHILHLNWPLSISDLISCSICLLHSDTLTSFSRSGTLLLPGHLEIPPRWIRLIEIFPPVSAQMTCPWEGLP